MKERELQIKDKCKEKKHITTLYVKGKESGRRGRNHVGF